MFGNIKRKASDHINNRSKRALPSIPEEISGNIDKRRTSDRLASKNQEVNSTTIQSVEMSSAQEIFDSLRIPDVIKDLQTFDGNPKFLPDFLRNVEEILLFIRNTDGTPYGQVLLRAIRNKIIGPANESLNSHLIPLNWDEIKKTLTNLYTDKRDESTLIRELHSIRQYNQTTEQFYNTILDIQSALLSNIRIRESNQSVQNSKKRLYQDMALNVFLTGLREPLGAIIRAMRPEDLCTALNYCQKEQNITFNKSYRFNSNPYPKPHSTQNPYNSMQMQGFQSPPIAYHRQRYTQPNPHYTQNQPSFSQNPFNNYNQNHQYPQIGNSNSGMTRQNTSVTKRNFPPNLSTQSRFNNRRQNFKIEEINNINNTEDDQTERENFNIDDTQNFQTQASENHWAT